MANYTLRIQFVGNPSESIYDDLHARMQKGGFLRTIEGVDSARKESVSALPHGTYYGSSDADVSQVRDWAKDHAKEAWGKSIVFVAQTDTWAWGKT